MSVKFGSPGAIATIEPVRMPLLRSATRMRERCQRLTVNLALFMSLRPENLAQNSVHQLKMFRDCYNFLFVATNVLAAISVAPIVARVQRAVVSRHLTTKRNMIDMLSAKKEQRS